jgi:hypothetical protein
MMVVDLVDSRPAMQGERDDDSAQVPTLKRGAPTAKTTAKQPQKRKNAGGRQGGGLQASF